jgi:hypothetical protein
MAAKEIRQGKRRLEIPESMFYDKYYVIKKSKARDLAQRALHQLYEEGKLDESGTIEIEEVLERLCTLQGSQYFAMNLDEKASIEAMKVYYRHKYGPEAADACVKFILGHEVGKGLVFKGKCIMSGKVAEVWRHPDGGKVFEVEDTQGGRHTVPERWVVKWLENEEVVEKDIAE